MAANPGAGSRFTKAAAALLIAGSVAAVPIVKKLEGRSLTTYYDIAGILTYCDGETLQAVKGRTYTDAQCDEITKKRVLQCAEGVAESLTYEVSQQTFNALTIFSYNTGGAALKDSTALRLVNAGQVAQGCEALMLFVCYSVPAGQGDRAPVQYAPTTSRRLQEFNNCVRAPKFNKKFSKGLANRRDFERDMCLAGAQENDSH